MFKRTILCFYYNSKCNIELDLNIALCRYDFESVNIFNTNIEINSRSCLGFAEIVSIVDRQLQDILDLKSIIKPSKIQCF